MMVLRARRRACIIAAALAAGLLLGGCGELLLLQLATIPFMPAQQARWTQTNPLTVAQPAAEVYAVIEPLAGQNGRHILQRDAVAGTLRLSYPFSLLKNNWGGTLRIVCTAGDAGTTITIFTDGRDAAARTAR
jgi:hypothetical protein